MIILTPHNLHILNGFTLSSKSINGDVSSDDSSRIKLKNFERILVWNPICANDLASSTMRRQQFFIDTLSLHASEWMKLSCNNDVEKQKILWMNEIWKDILNSDMGYSRMPLVDVRKNVINVADC